MENETLELVLKEMLEEQKNVSKTTADLVSAINQLTTKINGFNNKLEKQNIIAPTTDLKPVEEVVKKGVMDIRLLIAAQPKNVVRKFQILLFPEQDAKLFYKIIFSRWFMWLAVIVFLNFFYKWAVHQADNKKEIMIEVSRNDKIVKSWNHLYELKDKALHRRMDSALLISGNPK